MALTIAPICDFGSKAVDFDLPGIDGNNWSLQRCRGDKGLLVMFICNHCPYVKAVQDRIVRDTRDLLAHGINSVAIMPNDPADYPEDSFANMEKIASQFQYTFPYLIDRSQEIARAYGAVCTPDFFGYNSRLELQYRGRLDASRNQPAAPDVRREMFEAMLQIAATGQGPAQHFASMGCSIKWQKDNS